MAGSRPGERRGGPISTALTMREQLTAVEYADLKNNQVFQDEARVVLVAK